MSSKEKTFITSDLDKGDLTIQQHHVSPTKITPKKESTTTCTDGSNMHNPVRSLIFNSHSDVSQNNSNIGLVAKVDTKADNVINDLLVTPTKSSRPTPRFFSREITFSTKHQRISTTSQRPRPPRPPTKSFSSARSNLPIPDKQAVSVTFNTPSLNLVSPYYKPENQHLVYFEQCFVIIKKIGAGSFGDVYKVKSKDDSQLYAIKKAKEKFKGVADRKRKLEEVRKHEFLPSHENCVQLHKAWEENHYLYMQLELCEMSLSQFASANHQIPEAIVWRFYIDLIQAIKHLHSHSLIHLDIKPENIFISKEAICKLGDFGLMCTLNNSELKDAQDGDPKYLASELMQCIFTVAADIFSLGITILELATDLDLPTGGPLWHQLREGQIPENFTKDLSVELLSEINAMMSQNYQNRPTADQLLTRALAHMEKCEGSSSMDPSARNAFKNLVFSQTPLDVDEPSTSDIGYSMLTPDTQPESFLHDSPTPPRNNVSEDPRLTEMSTPIKRRDKLCCRLNFDDDENNDKEDRRP